MALPCGTKSRTSSRRAVCRCPADNSNACALPAPLPDGFAHGRTVLGARPDYHRRIEELMVELKQKYTIAIVTHNLQQAMRVADKTAFMFVDTSPGWTDRLPG